jgi:hypothetical protein
MEFEIAAHEIIIDVRPEDSWGCDDWLGCRIGEALPWVGQIAVNSGLTALAHELAHVFETWIDGEVGNGHSQWDERGITAADLACYRSELAAARSAGVRP